MKLLVMQFPSISRHLEWDVRSSPKLCLTIRGPLPLLVLG
jgi:hypothetical protein